MDFWDTDNYTTEMATETTVNFGNMKLTEEGDI